jgi:hypothetical protein
MKKDKNILLIGTNEIDCFFGIASSFDKQGARVIQVHSIPMAITYLQEQSFDAILINLEPDGKGGVGGIEILRNISESQGNQNAICFSISAVSATALLSAHSDQLNDLSIIVGWLTLPVDHAHAVDLILDIITSPNSLAVKDRLPK